MWQTRWVVATLKALFPDAEFDVINIKTQGDKILDVPLAKIGDKGLFVKELEKALSDGQIDFAVHSMKDMPTALPEDLTIGAITEREDPHDVLISRLGVGLEQLPQGARLGTSSLRRSAQLRHFRPDLRLLDLRGNLDTRLRKADTEEFDGVIVAAAGVHRLEHAARITQYIPYTICLPAVGQGALAVESRRDDRKIQPLLDRLNHEPTRLCVGAERALMNALEGGCQIPIGAHAELQGTTLVLDGVVASLDGSTLVRAQDSGAPSEALEIGQRLAARLIEMGAGEILREVRGE